MKRFLIKDAMLDIDVYAASTTASGTSTVADRAGTASDTYLNMGPYLSLQLLSQVATASGSPSFTIKVMGVDQSTTSGASSTTLASVTDTGVAAGDMQVITIDGEKFNSYPYAYVSNVVKSGKATVANLYVLEAKSKPVTQTDVDASTTVAG